MDFRENAAPPLPIMLGDIPVQSVDSFSFLGVTITRDLKWEQNPIAQKRLFSLRQLRKFICQGPC